MPIKGLSDRGVSFPQIGNIRKGAPKEPNKPGADLPYFRMDFDEREVKAIAKFNQLYPNGKPTAITVILPFDEIERVWNPWREAYVAGALLHRCDGEFINYAINPQTGEVVVKNGLDANGQPVKCTLQKDPDKRKRCKPTGRLHVIVPELERLAYLVVHTTSIHDIANISDQLMAIRELNGGHIAGIPLVLRRRPVKISTPSGENGKRERRVKWLISIEADPEWVAAKIGAMKVLALPPGNGKKSDEPIVPMKSPEWSDVGGEDEDDDEIIVEGEFVEPDAEHKERPQAEAPITETPKAEKPAAPAKQPFKKSSVRFDGMTPGEWHKKIDAFAAEHPNWQKDKRTDPDHILISAAHVGYEYVTGANVDEVLAAIVAAHEAKEKV